MTRVTLKQVAAEAGVSVPTVSLVLNDRPARVSDETRERIHKAARSLRYVGNQVARNLRKGSTSTIGVIVPDIANEFYAELAKGIERACSERGWKMILTSSDNHASREAEYIDELYARSVDGIILANAPDDGKLFTQNMDYLDSFGMPYVLLDRSGEGRGSAVTGDHLFGGREATRHLLDLGHRKIACITGPMFFEGTQSRVQGYKQALEDVGEKFNPSLIYECDYTFESALKIARAMDMGKFTAVFAFNDLMALAFIKAAKEQGFVIPIDRSVIGYDDMPFNRFISPGLTTMRQPLIQMGSDAATIIISAIDESQDDTSEQHTVLKVFRPRLIIRSSTAPPTIL
ncbi:TPA: LacI family transcriptional regulator [Klebsiella quasipneumoniae subsp. quasipneumoniae]|nr:LacI family transcriptional regulator [Klebsiella quasipneumoniae subsp. quasipneumoniae]